MESFNVELDKILNKMRCEVDQEDMTPETCIRILDSLVLQINSFKKDFAAETKLKPCFYESMHNLLCDVRYAVLYQGLPKDEAYEMLNAFVNGIYKIVPEIQKLEINEEDFEEPYVGCSNCYLPFPEQCAYHELHFEFGEINESKFMETKEQILPKYFHEKTVED